MAEKVGFGALTDESFFCKSITWKIPDVLSLPTDADFAVRSREFSFANATWVLSMHPRGQTKFDSASHVDFAMRRMQSRVSEHGVFYKFFLRSRKSKEFKPLSGFAKFSVLHCDNFLARKFLEHSDLVAKQKTIAPKGTLTVVCQMRAEKSAEATSNEKNDSKLIGSIEREKLPAPPNTKLLHDLEGLLLKGECCDVTLYVSGKKFNAHRAILAARSTVFASMLRRNSKEKNTGPINIPDFDPETFPDFLRFLYCGVVEGVTSQNVCSLYRASDKYDVQDLKAQCLAYMKSHLDVDSFCDVIALALKHGETDLVDRATGFLAKNLAKVIATVKWQLFLLQDPIQSNELLIKALAADKSASA